MLEFLFGCQNVNWEGNKIKQNYQNLFAFLQNLISGAWVYKHCDLRPWDPRNDLVQFESNYVISTKTRHRTPMIRTSSIVSVEPSSVRKKMK